MKYTDISDITNGVLFDGFSFHAFMPRDVRIAIFGTGTVADAFENFLITERPDVRICYYIDTISSGAKNDLQVVTPKQIHQQDTVDVVVICSHAHAEISQILRSEGIDNHIRIDPMSDYLKRLLNYSGHSFADNLTQEQAEAVFKTNVAGIAIEPFNYCNRSCDYCPVKNEASRKTKVHMPQDIFHKIISDLKRIDYKRNISFNHFNEPLSDKAALYSKMQYIRAELPSARLWFATNGDFLDVTTLRELDQLGLAYMYITIHLLGHEVYSDALAEQKVQAMVRKLDLEAHVDSVVAKEHYQIRANYGGMPITMACWNIREFGNTRGGLLDLPHLESRTSPCIRPFVGLYIGFDGTIFPCCHLFPDDKKHREQYSAGNVRDFKTIYQAYASRLHTAWRRSLFRFGKKFSPCDTCNDFLIPETAIEASLRDRIFSHMTK